MLDSAPALSQEAVDLWVKSFQGEVLGEAYFSRMSEMAEAPNEKHKLQALASLEALHQGSAEAVHGAPWYLDCCRSGHP